jgi:hypothetical protein
MLSARWPTTCQCVSATRDTLATPLSAVGDRHYVSLHFLAENKQTEIDFKLKIYIFFIPLINVLDCRGIKS